MGENLEGLSGAFVADALFGFFAFVRLAVGVRFVSFVWLMVAAG